MSAARIPKRAPGSLDDEQRAVYDTIAGGRRAQGPQLFQLVDDDGALEGPFNAFLLQPRLGAALQAVGSAVRYETSLTDRAREIAILVVAGVNLAVQARDWSTQRIVRELRPAVLATCGEISGLLSEGTGAA